VLTQAQKQETVAELKEKLSRASSVFVADYRGLTVDSVNRLRSRLRADGHGGYEYRVVKNTLLRRAVAGSAVEPLATHFQGPTAIAISFGDPVGLAKALVEYAKENEAFTLRGGWLEGRTLESREIATLATLPTLEELRARLAGLVLAPAQKLASLLVAPGGQLARLVEARRAQLAEGEGA
jgi:large subunit ribosomal protein L10